MRRLVSFGADVLGSCLRAGRPVGGALARFARLAALRSRLVDGRVPVTTQFDGPVRSSGLLRLTLGEHVRFGAHVFLETCAGGRIDIGAHVRINMGAVLVSYAQITIGSHCLMGEYVSIRDADHGSKPGSLIRNQPHVAAPICIGEDVWIARGAVILKGVTIGAGAVIGANSVV
ncbi:MAG: acyltransferase, partial [Planctomycetota bacterium]